MHEYVYQLKNEKLSMPDKWNSRVDGVLFSWTLALKLVWHIASDLLSCLLCWRKFPQYLSSIKTYIICLQLTSVVAEKSPTSALTSRVEPEKQETNKTVEGMWWCYKESPGTP